MIYRVTLRQRGAEEDQTWTFNAERDFKDFISLFEWSQIAHFEVTILA